MLGIVKKLFGSRNERTLAKIQKIVDQINGLESHFQALSDVELLANTTLYKDRIAKGESLDQLLPEAFANVREASRRTLGLRHFDVQLIGGIVLHQGNIAEMRTGEGKTLVGTLPAYLHALSGKGVHIVTVNDYLAERDANWMRPIYEFLGLTVGINKGSLSAEEKRAAYQADITYGTNNEFGFDYLRDNMAFSLSDKVQRDLNFALVDEVDSILIDEARTPLIISGIAEDSSALYLKVNTIIPLLTKQTEPDGPGDYYLDEKQKQAHLTEAGHLHIEELLVREKILAADDSLYSVSNIALLHHLNAALRAHTLFNRDVDYIIQQDEVVIVDEHTGRTMPGRRWSDGLHQAIEAKERVTIKPENQTLATITFQNYFRLYNTLSGMTGTADTEAYEFQQIYNLDVVVIPTNKPMQRRDNADQVFLTKAEKYQAVIAEITARQKIGQPILVGTASIEASEYLSQLLKKAGIKHQVLNAKQHEREATIISEAGRPGTVTIATNMAGRGTDIVLGGSLAVELAALGADASPTEITALRNDWQQRHDAVLAAGGLYIIGSERHESRRIDNQLRGRSGRQGDAGESRFYLSLEDDLMRIFAAERVSGLMKRMGMGNGEALEHRFVNRIIENAQRKVEAHNFDIRKQLLEFDNVANDQRRHIYEQRAELLAADDISDSINAIRQDVLEAFISVYIAPQSIDSDWDIAGLELGLRNEFALQLPIHTWLAEDSELHEENLRERILAELIASYAAKEALVGHEGMRHLEKSIMLYRLDHHWKEHLAAMDHLRQGIHLQGYAQKNPKQEYKRSAFSLFTHMLEDFKFDVISTLSTVQVQTKQEIEQVDVERRELLNQPAHYEHPHSQPALALAGNDDDDEGSDQTYVRNEKKVGRNESCPCGSGKKYKQCHGQL